MATHDVLPTHSIDDQLWDLAVQGYTVLPDAVPSDTLKEVRNEFDKLLAKFTENKTFPFGNCRMDVPLIKPFLQEMIVAHPLVLPLVYRLLGDDAKLEYFASNTAMPGSTYQHVHSDNRSLFPTHEGTLPLHALVVDFPLVDFTVDNGPLEIWPGTHRIPEALRQPDVIERAANRVPPQPTLICAGDILVRDIRMWHRGTPNHTQTPRPMLALVYFREWYEAKPKLTIPREAFEEASTEVRALLRYAVIKE